METPIFLHGTRRGRRPGRPRKAPGNLRARHLGEASPGQAPQRRREGWLQGFHAASRGGFRWGTRQKQAKFLAVGVNHLKKMGLIMAVGFESL